MVVGEPNINNIMGGIENTGSVRLHNHRKKLKQRFDIIKKLGQGTYGKVQLGINKETGQEVAIKTIKKSKIETEADLVRIRREIQIMSSVQHPNIIHIYEVFENREKMVLVMEYAAGGELYDYLSERKVLVEEEARRIFRQIATACYYCHKHKICHRDLKLENILLDEHGNAKIADFGLSNVFDDQRLLATFCGSPLYASPEIVKGTPYQGPEVDCWSLGVLLYTLVYGAMPFDGSNFKRLVKQISQGDYFEPKKPSRASPLIHDMLTVNPKNRANIEKICMHFWVNETYDDCCLDISEELANQTPVRLDLLLSLAPPAPQLESEKLVVTGEIAGDAAATAAENTAPTRSQSAGSLMDMTNSAERRIKDLLIEDLKSTPKRKLETTVSTDQANFSKEGVKRKEKIIKENTIADITLHSPIQENVLLEDASMAEETPSKPATRLMDVETAENLLNQGAVCSEIIEEAKKNQKKVEKPVPEKTAEKSKDIPTAENKTTILDKENVTEAKKEEDKQKPESKIPAKRKVIKKKVLSDKNDNSESKTPKAEKPKKQEQSEATEQKAKTEDAQPPTKPVERRRSRIFETTEKFQNLISASETKGPAEKPKKIVIPGVSVGGFKKEFERKASLTEQSKISLSRKSSTEQDDTAKPKATNEESPVKEQKSVEVTPTEAEPPSPVQEKELTSPESEVEENKRAKIQNAVSVISNALDGTRKSKSRPCMTRKPPVPFGSSGRSASGSIQTLPMLHSPPPVSIPPTVKQDANEPQGSTPAQVLEQTNENTPEENKTSSAEITLKSATLPRRKTTKAEIKLDYPSPKPATMGFKTEMAHHVEAPPKLATQRSEVTVPLASNFNVRSISLEPESKLRQTPRERIIPISFEKGSGDAKKEHVIAPPFRPPITKTFQTQRSTISQRSNSLSRQSTQESDSETTVSAGEPIRKSPREYIIPIAVEGGGYVTPRAGSLEPSDTASTTSTMASKSKFARRRFNDREGSEDESPFGLLHRHSSFGRDSDTEDPRRDMFRMHSLRSSRPRKSAIEHNDSFSSGEEDDDDGFEILTAENLFSTLLSRVRDLTSRLNVDGRPGFPTSRLLASHFDRDHSNFWNDRFDPLSRHAPISRTTSRDQSVDSGISRGVSGVPWRRSVSRDLASDIDSVFKTSVETPTHTATLPRGDTNAKNDNLNLTDLNLKKLKLSDEDALALSYLTPGLSRRIQKQLFAQLAPSEAKKLSRTLSMRNSTDSKPLAPVEEKPKYKPTTSTSFNTLPRRFSVEPNPARYQNFKNNERELGESCERGKSILSDKDDTSSIPKFNRSFVPVKPYERDYNRSESNSMQNGCDYRQSFSNQSFDTRKSPDTSTSESLSYKNDDYSGYKNINNVGSNYSDSSRLVKYLTPNNVNEDYNSNNLDSLRRRSPSSSKRTSRFLRSDFYDAPKDESYFLREKKEREMETQKVLKEIRDRRKGRYRDGSVSRESSRTDVEEKSCEDVTKRSNTDLTDNLLKKVSDNIKNIESNVKEFHNYVNVDGECGKIHDYVNVPADVNANNQVIKKERISKIARPKSYPNEAHIVAACIESEKVKAKNSKLKKPEAGVKASESEPEKQSTKNKFLQTIEKLRSFSNSPSSVCSDEKKSLVEDTIKRLREQSVPRNIENCSTESGLLKRAVSVEDVTTPDSNQLQPSRKSVTKILSLFKRYEDKSKKNDKNSKSKKPKEESSKKVKDDTKKSSKSKNSQLNVKKTDKGEEGELAGAPTVIQSNNFESNSDVSVRNTPVETLQHVEPGIKIEQVKKVERPRSLLLDPTKQYQPSYNGAKSENNISDKDTKQRVSKLPVNSFRRSLNLENAQFETPGVYKISNGTICELQDKVKPDYVPHKVSYQNRFRTTNPKSPEPSTSVDNALYGSNRNSYILTDDGSVLLSPCEDDMSYDSWSQCSDYQNQDLTSPLSPCSNFYSADENESVSDRIRRKSFYTRFNEKKRPRKNTMSNYRDLDLYKEMNRKSSYNPLDYRLTEPSRKFYVRSSSASVSDSISNMANQPDRYQAYGGSKMNRRSTSVCLYNEPNSVDDNSVADKNTNYSNYNQTSRFSDSPNSPPNGHRMTDAMSSSLNYNHNVLPSTSHQPL